MILLYYIIIIIVWLHGIIFKKNSMEWYIYKIYFKIYFNKIKCQYNNINILFNSNIFNKVTYIVTKSIILNNIEEDSASS